MTSVQEFKCIFCKESFDNKEELQIHFRKHGDPNFNNQKNKGRVQSAVQVSNDSSKDVSELVGCDVCTEVFPTISKAITHKHKVHPEHDAKYFCPWCGKLFTMKHLYNKHMQANHSDLDKNEENIFHCDSCNVDFHLPAAMINHNKFFHRQDTDIPLFGLSKKLKMYNQEVISIYYCSFCGEEYENKVNLHKHSIDDHSDENQSPDVVLRCPLCDAIFYHLDAYELHLTFHTPDDLYSERSEMADDVSEYSLESVPPIMEKVESGESQGVESTMNAIGIEDFLEQALEEPDGAVIKKNKKHKKHKKSKKSAITLDEFLNMNKDVFGEGLDIQGVEEVPTRAITKRLKVIKKTPMPPASEINPELEKLRKHGIVIKKNPGQNISLPNNKVISNKSFKPTQTIVSKKIHSEPIVSTSEDTIDKLINQTNSQIKIVKKCNKDISSNSTKISELNKSHEESTEMECDSTKKDMGEFPANDVSLENISVATEDTDKTSKVQEIALLTKCHIPIKNTDETQYNDIDNTSSIDESTELQVQRNETQTFKSPANIDPVKVESTSNIDDNTENRNDFDSVPKKCDENLNNSVEVEKQTQINSLSTLKRLSHLITVKPVLSNKNTSTADSNLVKHVLPANLHANTKDNVDIPILRHTMTKVSETEPKNNELTTDLPLNVGKNILRKSLAPQVKSDTRNITLQGNEESDSDNRSNKNTNVQTSNINIARNDSFKSSELTQSKLLSMNTGKISSSPETNCNEMDKQDTTNLLKHLTGITAKPLNPTKCTNKINASLPTRNIINKNVRKMPQREILNNEEVEIYNIDDSDDDIDQNGQNNQSDVSNSTQPSDVLRNLSKNITVRSLSTSDKSKMITQEVQKEIYPDDRRNLVTDQPQRNVSNEAYVSDLPNRITAKPLNEKDEALKNAIKHLGKNVTVKSRNTSSQSERSQDKNVLNCKYENNTNSLKTVKITEVTDECCDDESENDHIGDNVIVESPDDSHSDKEDNFYTDTEEADFENQIDVNMLRKDNDQIKSPQSEDRKQLPENIAENEESSESNLNLEITKSLGNQISIKPVKQVRKEVKHENIPNTAQICGQTSNNSQMKQKMSTSNQLNTVNKQVMVKTFQTQTKTVIQEITTTVTKTIKTVNQTLKQEVQNVNTYSSSSIPPQKVQGMRVHQPSRNLQGIVVRQSSPPMRPKIRNASPAISAVGTTVRHSSPVIPVGTAVRPPNQIVPVRPRSNVVRPCNPRMPGVQKIRPSTSNQSGLRVPRPPRISSNAMVIPVKRPSMEDTSGPFSCFKKPKESLIPVSDIPTFNNEDSESMTEYTSMCKSNSMSTSSTVKGNAVVTSSQMKSEVNTSSQQLIRLNNTSGIKVTKTSQSKQAQVQETSEISASQRTTLEAIQKLQKQGLLVKKPRLDIRQDSDGSDHSGNNSTDENDC